MLKWLTNGSQFPSREFFETEEMASVPHPVFRLENKEVHKLITLANCINSSLIDKMMRAYKPFVLLILLAILAFADSIESIEAEVMPSSLSSSSTVSGSVRSTAASGSTVYESERAVHEYLLTHYGDKEEQMPFDFGPRDATGFPRRSAEICSRFANVSRPSSISSISSISSSSRQRTRALDVGCAVGGQSFQLAKYFDDVVGIDFSRHFIDAANEMKVRGGKSYNILKQGKIFQSFYAQVEDVIDRSKVNFYQGDACNLDKNLGKYDVILASNLLCRLPKPRDFLRSVPSFLTENGHFVLISPYSWLDEYTNPSEWMGGRLDSDGNSSSSSSGSSSNEVSSSEVIISFVRDNLPEMVFVSSEQVPFLIREHFRKYQYGVSECLIWKKTM